MYYCFCQASSYSTCSIQILQALLGCVLHCAAESCGENSRRSKYSQQIYYMTILFSFSRANFSWHFFSNVVQIPVRGGHSEEGLCSLLRRLETSGKLQTRLYSQTQPVHRAPCLDVLHKAVASSFAVPQRVTQWSKAMRHVFLC